MHQIAIFIILFAFSSLASPITPEIQGVNLGGWFILEKFITPNFFSKLNDSRVGSEWQYVQYYRNDSNKMDVLRNHWDTWVQEKDIERLSNIGFTHVRLPIGYWAVLSQEELDNRNEYYLTGQLPYLVRCIKWLKQYGIKAIIDLHGAPGSQNGWDNSGQLLAYDAQAGWGKGDTVNRTIDVIEKLSIFIRTLEEDNTTSDTVVGLELINEAFPWKIQGGLDTIKDYYLRAYPVVRNHLPADKYMVMIEWAFTPDGWFQFMSSPEYQNVVLDAHIYQCFDGGIRQASYQTHLNISCQDNANTVKAQTLPTVVGEWSVAFKMESATANNEPYPNTEEAQFMRRFALAQMKSFGSHFFWNFKTESAPMWDYFLGIEGGWLTTLPPDVQDACVGH